MTPYPCPITCSFSGQCCVAMASCDASSSQRGQQAVAHSQYGRNICVCIPRSFLRQRRTMQQQRNPPTQPYNRGRRRACMSHCCFICNIGSLQKKMPQVLLINEHTLSQSEFKRIVEAAPPHVYVKLAKSAWMNEEIMCILVRLLHEHLKDEWDLYHVVLMLDAFSGHIHYNVQLQCNRFHIALIVIPANLTWLLQPCDTHVFAIYKKYMRKLWSEHVDKSPDGVIDMISFLTIVFAVIMDIVQATDWSYAFKEDGFYTHFGYLSNFIMKQLKYESKPPIVSTLPSVEDVRCCFPKRRAIVGHILLKQLQQPRLLALPAPASAPILQDSAPAVPAPRGIPLRPRRPILALTLGDVPAPWRKSTTGETQERQALEKGPPVTRSQSKRLLEMSQAERNTAQENRPGSSTDLPPKRRKLPWKSN